MGYEFSVDGGDGYLHLNIWGWGWVLEHAKENGWVPAGTLEPDGWRRRYPETPWPGCYDTNDHQFISKAEAPLLADAIEKAMEESDVWRHGVAELVELLRSGKDVEIS